MKILSVALKESLPGTHGGAVHVLEVSEQLARRGHDVTVVVQQRANQTAHEKFNDFELRRVQAKSNFLLWQLEPTLREILEQVQPDVLMERYYNFAGAGVRAAQRARAPILLEVNAPMMDPPGSRKFVADQLLFGAMTRMAREQAIAADRIVTPLAVTVPFADQRAKVREIPWGANVELFERSRLNAGEVERLRAQINPQGKRVVVFSGSFRAWHGVRELVKVAQEIARGRDDILFLMLGAGDLEPELRAQVSRARLEDRIVLTGAVPYARVPYYLALADLGVAPFNMRIHPPLRLGFYWSPLKVHEYMAMGLPVVTIDAPGLNQIARHEREGLLYPEGDNTALRAAILRLVDDPAWAQQLGRAGRMRVVENFSWQRHAALLEQILFECRDDKAKGRK